MNEISNCYLNCVCLGKVELYGNIGKKYIKIYLELYFFIHISVFVYMHVHFVCLFAPLTQGVTWAYNRTFRSYPGCLMNVLCTVRLWAVSKVGTYV